MEEALSEEEEEEEVVAVAAGVGVLVTEGAVAAKEEVVVEGMEEERGDLEEGVGWEAKVSLFLRHIVRLFFPA